MEEQETGNKSILDAISRLNAVTGAVYLASEDMTGECKAVLTQSIHLEGLTQSIDQGINERTGLISAPWSRTCPSLGCRHGDRKAHGTFLDAYPYVRGRFPLPAEYAIVSLCAR
ncbi:hypothetical protein Holit_01065 [Hollandina sp. SP2]